MKPSRPRGLARIPLFTGRSFGKLSLVAAAVTAAACASMSPSSHRGAIPAPSEARRALVRAGLRPELVPTQAGPLRVFAGGRGARTVVLLHGSGRQAGDWAGMVRALRADAMLLVPDLPGHGESAPATGPLPVGELVRGLEALVDAERPTGRVTLVGNSLGGWVALLYAARHPERVERVVGISSSGIYAPLAVKLLPASRAEAAALSAAIRGPHAPAATDAELDALVTAVAAGPLPRLVAGLRAEDFLETKAAAIDVPVDLIWGADDGVLPPDYGRRLAGLLPRAAFHLLPDCGHMPQLFCPGKLVPMLRDVLKSPPPEAHRR